MRIGFLGMGTWGFSLANLLACNGHQVIGWTSKSEFAKALKKSRQHPKLPQVKAHEGVIFTSDIQEALEQIDVLAESVTSQGIRIVFGEVKKYKDIQCPIILTSKGIEQNSCLLLPEVVVDVLGEDKRKWIGALSGPSHAEEVIQNLPTSVVGAAYHENVMHLICQLFASAYFRVYPNTDLQGVAFGGAMKNIIAIACGISDGLGFGDNTKAALMTRGLHEIRKLSVTKGCKPETLNGLAGLGDLCVTCLSTLSRNYKFGRLIAEGFDMASAKEKIGMVVEGIYTCIAARQLAHLAKIAIPITEAIYSILYENMSPKEAVKALLQRAIKEELL